jgi:hypothetical protein
MELGLFENLTYPGLEPLSLKGNMKCLGFPTARCINFKSMPIVQSRNQRDAAARRGSAGRIVDARRRI